MLCCDQAGRVKREQVYETRRHVPTRAELDGGGGFNVTVDIAVDRGRDDIIL